MTTDTTCLVQVVRDPDQRGYWSTGSTDHSFFDLCHLNTNKKWPALSNSQDTSSPSGSSLWPDLGKTEWSPVSVCSWFYCSYSFSLSSGNRAEDSGWFQVIQKYSMMATSMKKSKPESEKPAIPVCPNAVLNQHIWQSTKLSAEGDCSGQPVLGICHPGTLQRTLDEQEQFLYVVSPYHLLARPEKQHGNPGKQHRSHDSQTPALI